jgi:hypothetical protein
MSHNSEASNPKNSIQHWFGEKRGGSAKISIFAFYMQKCLFWLLCLVFSGFGEGF